MTCGWQNAWAATKSPEISFASDRLPEGNPSTFFRLSLAKRWFIHKDDKSAGPYTGAEIRQLLREGAVDPFDHVSAEGSSVKQELVEVDEIFVSDNVAYQDQAAGAESGAFVPQVRERSFSGREKIVAGSDTAAAGSSPPGQMIALASDMRKLGNSNNLPVPVPKENAQIVPVPRKKRDPKKYHLIDAKGRVLGPLSPGEIQSLYYRGVVDRSVKVMRDGSTSKVAVGKFVLSYAEAQGMKNLPKQGAHPNIHGASKSALNRLALMRRAQQMRTVSGMAPTTVAILCIAFVLIALTVGLLIKDGALLSGGDDRGRREAPRGEDRPPAKKTAPSKRAPERTVPKKQKPPQAVSKPPARSVGRTGGALARPGGVRQAVKVQRSTRPVAKATPQQVRPLYQRPKPPPRPVYTSPRVVQPARPVARPVASVAAPAVQKPAGNSIASLQNGQTVKGFGPLTFNKDSVDICEGACTVMFFGAGGSVSVAFFKSAWGPALMSKSGPVYISGSVRKSGGSVKILLNGVR